MGSFSILHWLIVLAFLVVFIWPISRILKRAGFSPWLALIYLVPLVNIGALWALAYVKWPAMKDAE